MKKLLVNLPRSSGRQPLAGCSIFLGSASLVLALSASQAEAANMMVTLEAPGVQQSTLLTDPTTYGAQNVIQESFNSLIPGYDSNGFTFTGNIGTYTQGTIVKANQYGGAGGSNYLTIQPGAYGAPSSYNQTTLMLNSPQRYFGFWWSAGDPGNVLQFYSGNQLLSQFTTADVISFIKQQPNAAQYYGNPTSNFLGQNRYEPYAFLNFFADPTDTSVTFDRITFINPASSGFESDNHTIVASYLNTSGQEIINAPEPGFLAGNLLALGVGIKMWFRRQRALRTMKKAVPGH